MRSRLVLSTAVLAVGMALVAVPLTSASAGSDKLQIGYSLTFPKGPGAAVGTFVATGAVNDAGSATSAASFTSPIGSDGFAHLKGTATLVGHLGTITEEFSGVAGPVGAAHETAKGTFRVVGGTGAYSNLTGNGEFLVVVDFSTLQAVRMDVGRVGNEGDDTGD